jgi:hypothetical protein
MGLALLLSWYFGEDTMIRKLVLVAALFAAGVLLMAGCLLTKSDTQTGKLTYKLPAELSIKIGSELPGTGIVYESMGADGAHVVIKGQKALKRKGDSLDWRGNPAAGVSVDLKMRVAWFTDKELYLVGTAQIVIDGVSPRAAAIPSSLPIKYTGPVAYGLAQGATIPGSIVSYAGQTTDGAKLGGIEGYAYRKLGDSILWEGTLRDGVYIRLDVRVAQFDEKGLRVAGLVTLGFTP